MSLLQGVLKANIEDIEGRLSNVRLNGRQRSSFDEDVNSDDDLVNVVSIQLLYFLGDGSEFRKLLRSRYPHLHLVRDRRLL